MNMILERSAELIGHGLRGNEHPDATSHGEPPLTSDPHQPRVKLRAGLVHRAVGEEIFVLMADSTVHWLKNAAAVALWGALADATPEGTTLSALSKLLVDEFEVESSRASADVTSFVHTLAERGVLEWVSIGPPGPSAPD